MATATAPAPKKSKTKTAIRPLNDKVLLERDEAETKTASGIFLPESSKEKPMTATVVAVGPGKVNTENGTRTPIGLKAGEKVIISKWAGSEIKLDDQDYLLVDASEILAVID
jgi:chaperonin GroES